MLLLQYCAFGQNEDVIGDFSAEEVNGKVFLTWYIKQGETCNGIQVLHSLDSVNFQQIGSIEGTCGSIEQAVPYDFTDLFPEKNAINYYRLNLGGVGFSKIVQAEIIDIASNNYLLRPNPVTSKSELHFKNDGSHLIELMIYTNEGKFVHRIETTNELIILKKDNYYRGVYLFTLNNTTTGSQVKGRFQVQ